MPNRLVDIAVRFEVFAFDHWIPARLEHNTIVSITGPVSYRVPVNVIVDMQKNVSIALRKMRRKGYRNVQAFTVEELRTQKEPRGKKKRGSASTRQPSPE